MGRQKPGTGTRAGRATVRTGPTGAGTGSTETDRDTTEAAQPVAPIDRRVEETMDTAQLQADADAALASAPPPPPEPGAPLAPVGPSQADIEKGYAMLAEAAIGMSFRLAAPAWEITNDETTRLSTALGHAVALWFPNEIPEKWVALIVVAAVGAEIVGSRRDPETGRLKPRFYPAKAAPDVPVSTGDAPLA